MTRQYQNGWDAASHGAELRHCPFKLPSTAHLACEWKSGWYAYYEQMRAA